jgi:predicted MPP superfamily phosphohydrolase
MADIKRDLLIPDQHIPFNDPTVWKLLCKLVSENSFDNIVAGGDFLDFGQASTHAKSPYQKTVSINDELVAGRIAIEQLTTAARKGNPEVRLHYIEGNHDYRLARYVSNQAPAFEGLTDSGGVPLTLPNLLGLVKHGWSYTPYRDYVKLGNCYITHDVKGRAGVMAHRQVMEALGVNIIHFHTHKLAVQYRGVIGGNYIYGAMLGWGGTYEAVAGYMDKLTAEIECVHGFGILYRYGSKSTIVPVPISDGACVVEGKLVAV